MDCVIAAGGRPTGDDPIYTYTNGRPKACIDLGGRTMLERVVDALQAAHCVDDIVVVGLQESDRAAMRFTRPLSFLPDHGSLIGNSRAGLEWLVARRPETEVALLCSADIPLITGPIIDDHIESCRPFDRLAYYTFVSQETMENRFPHSKRTFVRLRGLRVAGGDLLVVRSEILDSNDELWEAMTNARKHAWRLASLVGLPFLIKFLLRRAGIDDIETVAERMLGGKVGILLSPHAELAMDADKPAQIDLMRRHFNKEYA